MRPVRPGRPLWLAVAALAIAVTLPACGDDDDGGGAAADQARQAALEAGLAPAVADFLALAARGTQATYEATFVTNRSGSEQTIVVSQRPPDRRVDIVVADGTIETTLLTDGNAYQCSKPPEGVWECVRVADGAAAGPVAGGVFDEATLQATTAALANTGAGFTLEVEQREVAGTDVTCLVAKPGPATTTSGSVPADVPADAPGTLCLSAEGAILLAERTGEQVAATGYSTTVEATRFDVPAEPATPTLPTG